MRFRAKLAYSMGSFANTLCYQAFSNRIQFFYIVVVGLEKELVAGIWILFGIWNSVNDPLMGLVTDRTRSRWGRRIPYLLFGAIPLGVSFTLLWTPPDSERIWVVAAYFMGTLFVFDTLYSLLIMAYNSLFPEIVAGQKDRADLASLREILSAVALILALALAPILEEQIGFTWMGIAFGVATTAGYLISASGCVEQPLPPPEKHLGFKASIRLALTHVPFRWFLVANLGRELVFLITVATMPFYAKYVLQLRDGALSAGEQEALLLAGPVVGTIPMLVVWGKITPKLGCRRAWICALVCYLPGLAILFFADRFSIGLVGTTLIAPGLAGLMMLPHVLLAEVIDADVRRVGLRREGIFFGINGAVVKLAFSVQGVLFAVVFWLSGFVEKAPVQPPSAVLGLRFMMAGAPILAAAMSIVALVLCDHDLARKEGPPEGTHPC